MATDREKITKRRQRRRKRRFKASFKIFICALILLIAGGSVGGYMYYQSKNAPNPYGKLEEIQKPESNNYNLTEEVLPKAKYWVLNAGKGEAIFVKEGDTEILIDTGADTNPKAIVDAIKGELVGDLDYLIITSESPRRMGGFRNICIQLKPKKIITCPLGDNARYIGQMAEGITIEEGTDSTIVLSENASLAIFRPEVSSKDPLDQSLMTLFKYGDTTFFAESDAGEEEEARVVEQVESCDAIVLARGGSDKVNQHIEDIKSNLYIASCSKDEPLSEAMIEKLGGHIYTTYKSGTIQFSTNGSEVESNLKKEDSLGKQY